jgi:hypothetical protein
MSDPKPFPAHVRRDRGVPGPDPSQKWTLIFGLVFGLLALAISYFGLVTAGLVGFQSFTRTRAVPFNCCRHLFRFGMAGVVIAFNADCSGAAGYVALFPVTLLLALVFLSLGAMVALVAKKRGRALSHALSLWFFFVLFYDLLIMGLAFLLQER